jgi:hypothetical protein
VDDGRSRRRAGRLIAAFLGPSLLCWAAPAHAQSFDSVGIRAQGMGGAFVAVANDATATWWNPAGLATGPVFDVALLRQTTSQPDDVDGAVRSGNPAQRDSVTGFAALYPALAISYFRLHIRQETPVSATDTADFVRQEGGLAGVSFQALNVSQYGITTGQSIGAHLVLGTTLKLLRGNVASEAMPEGQASFSQVDGLEGANETHADIDVGLMVSAGPLRLGVAAKNLHQPTFGDGPTAQRLARRVRAGAALEFQGAAGALTVAGDVDLSRNETLFGRERQLALGAEAWVMRRHVGIRGGWSTDISGESPSALSGGLSVSVWNGTYLEGFVTSGADSGQKSWGTDLRLTY